jgi:prepilin-type N-terminal cleavage/methylation domain-containing protein
MKNSVKKKFLEAVDRNEKGFTTIELIIVIVIAGIMAAVAIPKMNHISEVDLYTTARQVKSDIRYAQQLAMSKYTNTTITFNGGVSSITVNGTSIPPNEYAITGSGINTTPKFLPPNSRATFNAVGLGATDSTALVYTFDSTGKPTAGGGSRVVISSGGSSKQVVVSSVTGSVTIP